MTQPSYKREQVVDIINSVMVRLKTPNGISHDTLGRELSELKAIIDDLRNQLHSVQPADISTTHIPSASDELDAVVMATEHATVTIMDACEEILAETRDPAALQPTAVESCVIRIFEACTFQDITGQRIKKVTDSLKLIDNKIKSVLAAIEGQLINSDHEPVNTPIVSPSLLNGPPLPAQAVSQDDIDKLLAEFDTPVKE